MPLYVAVGSFDSQEMASVGWTASLETTFGLDKHAVIAYAGQFSADFKHIDATFVLSATGKRTEIGEKRFTLTSIGLPKH